MLSSCLVVARVEFFIVMLDFIVSCSMLLPVIHASQLTIVDMVGRHHIENLLLGFLVDFQFRTQHSPLHCANRATSLQCVIYMSRKVQSGTKCYTKVMKLLYAEMMKTRKTRVVFLFRRGEIIFSDCSVLSEKTW